MTFAAPAGRPRLRFRWVWPGSALAAGSSVWAEERWKRRLVFVDAPPPNAVRLHFEGTSKDPTEVTWW